MNENQSLFSPFLALLRRGRWLPALILTMTVLTLWFGERSWAAARPEATGGTLPPVLTVNTTGNGNVSLNPTHPNNTYTQGEVVTLTARADFGWAFANWSGDLNSTANPSGLVMTSDKSVTANFVANPSDLLSDDFNGCALNARWQYIDPLGNSTMEVNGEQVVITVPAGVTHDIWQGNMNAPRLLQTVRNTDFESEVKFESTMKRKYQLHGLLFVADSENLLRVNVQYSGSQANLVVVSFSGGLPTVLADEVIDNVAPFYLRVRRYDTQWSVFFSNDGTTWQTRPGLTFQQSLNVTQIGPFIGNAGPSPAYTGIIDYFFNTAAPIAPEDPLINSIPVKVLGNGRVNKSCGNPLTLTAVPDLGWNFSNWSGSLTGTQNPGSLPITGSEVVTATFTPKPLVLTVQLNGGGTVRSSPDQTYFDSGDLVTLTAIPNAGWVFNGWSGALTGDEAAKVLTMDSSKTVVANFRLLADNSGVQSDDFNTCALNTSRWSFTNPLNESTLELSGSQVKISVPSGTAHDVWNTNNNAPRVMQPINNADFALEAKFESLIDKRFQSQGMLIEADSANLVRINFQHNGNNTSVFAATFSNGVPRERFNQVIPSGAPLYLRVVRSGNLWAVFYSYNGEDWNTNSTMSFSFALPVTKAGFFVGNAGNNPPAHTGVIDYFFNAAKPIVPEDPAVNSLPPIAVVGQGTVTRSPACGNPITLTAVPAANWRFAGWSGDLTSTQNPVTVTAIGSERITANFIPLSGIQSDDFNGCSIDPAWTFINPKNDATFSRVGNQQIAITVPANVEHNVFPSDDPNALIIGAPHLMQPAANVDFELETKFESPMSARYQMQGILVVADDKNLVRFSYQHSGGTLQLASIGIKAGVATTYKTEELPNGTPMFLRVNRTGDNWTVDRSTDGVNWVNSATFTHQVAVAKVGLFAGNALNNPAHTAVVDYFFENRNRIEPEDASVNDLTITTDGQGSVTKTPNNASYGCGEQVQVQALPSAGWSFVGWSGALTGSQNPATVTMDRRKSLTAIFKEHKYAVTITSQGGADGEEPGVTSLSTPGPYFEGQVIKLRATPRVGYRFVKWVIGATELTEAEIEITVTGDLAYTAIFAKVEGPVTYQLHLQVILRAR